jgi:hypothetical protein
MINGEAFQHASRHESGFLSFSAPAATYSGRGRIAHEVGFLDLDDRLEQCGDDGRRETVDLDGLVNIMVVYET